MNDKPQWTEQTRKELEVELEGYERNATTFFFLGDDKSYKFYRGEVKRIRKRLDEISSITRERL